MCKQYIYVLQYIDQIMLQMHFVYSLHGLLALSTCHWLSDIRIGVLFPT